jgi:hypothetical protein
MTTERRPISREWRETEAPAFLRRDPNTVALSRWQRGAVVVLSTLIECELPDGSGRTGLTWHASISRLGKRPRPRDVEHFRRDFGLLEAEEDNHHPGGARHFFMPLDPSERRDCECKATETIIREPDGYQWTNPVDEPCRGCEFSRLRGKPCPIHGAEARP